MDKNYKVDICIIGAGAGGLSVASGASQLGIKVALVENHRMGGDCLNYGCVPSKSLLAAAKHYYHAANSHRFGFRANPEPIQIREVMNSVKEAVKHIEPHDSVERFSSLGVEVIKGTGSFISHNQLAVNSSIITADYFVIATGSSPRIPDIVGLKEVSYLTNESLFELGTTPEHLMVIGGGPIGCEIAQAFAMLGIKVTLITQGRILDKEDRELVEILRQSFNKELPNLTILENCIIKQIGQEQDSQISAQITKPDGSSDKIIASHLLVATGRQPNLDKLNLDKAGIESNRHGVIVDNRLRTTNKKIYAIGDVNGNYQFTHIAGYQAGIVIRNILFRQPSKVVYKAVPRVNYTYPELAQVGLTADESPADSQVYQFEFSNNDRAVTEKELTGKIKLVTSKGGKVLGVSILGSNAGELLTPWIDLINRGESIKQLTNNIIPYPTISEINKQVVGEYYKPILFSSKVKRLVRFLKLFW